MRRAQRAPSAVVTAAGAFTRRRTRRQNARAWNRNGWAAPIRWRSAWGATAARAPASRRPRPAAAGAAAAGGGRGSAENGGAATHFFARPRPVLPLCAPALQAV